MTRSCAVVILLLGGCTSVVAGGEDPSATSGTAGSTGPAAVDTTRGSTDDPSAGTTTPTDPGSSSSTGLAWETEGADEGYATTGNCGFTCPPPPGPGSGGGNAIECSISEQDCAQGEKCVPWANDGGSLWTGTRCAPVAPNPAGFGEPCTVEGAFVSGIDTCVPGLTCSPSNADSLRTNEGTCIALCDDNPCSDGTLCTVSGPLNLGACGAICDPLAEDACPPGQGCMPAGLGFACNLATVATVDAPCTTVGECDLGFVCTDASQCDQGAGEQCCAQLCDLAAPDCPGAQTCTDYGSPLAAYETVGFCQG